MGFLSHAEGICVAFQVAPPVDQFVWFFFLYYFFSVPCLYQHLFLFPFLWRIKLGKTRLGSFTKNPRKNYPNCKGKWEPSIPGQFTPIVKYGIGFKHGFLRGLRNWWNEKKEKLKQGLSLHWIPSNSALPCPSVDSLQVIKVTVSSYIDRKKGIKRGRGGEGEGGGWETVVNITN